MPMIVTVLFSLLLWLTTLTLPALTAVATGAFVPVYRGGICVANGSGTCVGGDIVAESGIGPQVGYMKTTSDPGTVPVYQSTCYSNASGTCTAWGLSLTANGTAVGYLSTTAPDTASANNPLTQSNGLLLQNLGGTPSAYLWSIIPPSIANLSPNSGPIATAVTISGSDFGASQGASTVTFNGVAGAPTSWSATSIGVPVPSGATTGLVVVSVAGSNSNGVTFTVTTGGGGGSPDLVVTSIGNPPVSSQLGASFNVTDTTANNGTASAAASLTSYRLSTDNIITGADPLLTGTRSVPALGAGSNSNGSVSVTIPSNLTPGTYYLGACADHSSAVSESNESNNCLASTNTIGVYAPLPPGSGIVYIYDRLNRLRAVVNPATDTGIYNYDAVGNLLSITRQSSSVVSIIEMSEYTGPTGSAVILHGTGFSTTCNQNAVTFNGTAATIDSCTANRITTTVPVGASSGSVNITNSNGSASGPSAFTVAATSAPTITTFTPQIGPAGTAITITGTNFSSTPAVNDVRINTNRAVVSLSSSTSISTSVPSNTGSGRVSVATGFGKATSSGDFFVAPSPYTASDVEHTGRVAIGGGGHVATVSTAGKVALVVFDAVAGQKLGLGISAVSIVGGNYDFYVLKPDGASLATCGNCGGARDIFLEIPVSGTYTAFLDPRESATGSMTLTLSEDLDAGSLVIDGSSLSVSVTRPGQRAKVTFAGTAGQNVSLSFSAVAGGNIWVTVSGPSGEVLIAPGNFNNNEFSFLLRESGTHSIVIDPNAGGSPSMTLTLSEQINGGTLVIDGSSPTVNISRLGQTARFTFSGIAGQKVSLGMTGVSIPSTNVSISGPALSLVANQNYDIAMEYYEAGGEAVAKLQWSGPAMPKNVVPQSVLTPPGGSLGQGLRGEYFNNTGLSGSPVLTRNDPTINFDWESSGPGSGVAVDNFSVRWTGQVRPTVTGPYSFHSTTDDGVRLWVNGQLLIDSWIVQGVTERHSTNALASTQVGTSGGSINTFTLPVTGAYTLLLDPSVGSTGSMTLTLSEEIDAGQISVGGAPVVINISRPGQTARLTFNGTASQLVNLGMSGVTIPSSIASISGAAVTLTANQNYDIKVEYFEAGGSATAHLRWSSPSLAKDIIPQAVLTPPGGTLGEGLKGEYFDNLTFSGLPVLIRTDPSIHFIWGSGSPGGAVPGDNFTIRWTGQVKPTATGPYSFHSSTDDGVRVWVDNQLLIDKWVNQGETEWHSSNLISSTQFGTSGGSMNNVNLPRTGVYTIVLDPADTQTGSVTFTLIAP